MAAIPPLSSLKTITHVTSHGSSVTPGDGNLGGAGAVTVATDVGPQPGEVALGPGDLIHSAFDAFHRFLAGANNWASTHPINYDAIKYGLTVATAAFYKYKDQISQAIEKYGPQVGQALTALATGAARIVGGVLEGVGGDLVPPITIDSSTLGGLNNMVSALGGPGSPAAQMFAAGVSAATSTFNGVG